MNEKAMIYMMNCMEKKLRQYMGDEAFFRFSERIAREAFKQSVDDIEDSDFKDFCRANFGGITEGEQHD